MVKDVRRRFSGLHHLNIWVLQYLCYFSLMKEPERIPLPLGPAFRRFFQLLSAGIFLPNAAPMYDPAEPSRPLGSDLTFEQMVRNSDNCKEEGFRTSSVQQLKQFFDSFATKDRALFSEFLGWEVVSCLSVSSCLSVTLLLCLS